MDEKIQKLVTYYVRKFNTRNPFEIADCLGILYQMGNIGCEGCYMFLKNHRYIFLNQNLSEHELTLVMAHELGHAIMHRKQNCYFIKHKTLLFTSKTEIEANKFAVELLIPDDEMKEYKDYSIEQLSRIFGYSEQLFSNKEWSSIPKEAPDDIDLQMLKEIETDPDCKEFINEKEALKMLEL